MSIKIVKSSKDDENKKNDILKPGQLVYIFNTDEGQNRFYEGNAIIVEHVDGDEYLVQFQENENWEPVPRRVVIDTEWKFEGLPEQRFQTVESIVVEVMRGNEDGVVFTTASYSYEWLEWPESEDGEVIKWRYPELTGPSGLSPKAEWARRKTILTFFDEE